MALFSRDQKDGEGTASPETKKPEREGLGKMAIPQEIFNSVRLQSQTEAGTQSVPGNGPRQETPPSNLPVASRIASPFLKSEPSSSSPNVAPPEPRERKVSIPAAPQPAPSLVAKSGAFPPLGKPIGNVQFETPPRGKKRFLVPIIALIILLFAGGGGYYYWQTLQSEPESAPSGTNVPVPSPSLAPAAIKTLPYSLDNPNYLTLDTESADAAILKSELDQVKKRLVDANITEPIAFVVTDKNNNPIAFTRFAYLAGLPLPEELLTQIDEPFTLYIATEAGKEAYGLELGLKDAAKGATLITTYESRLPKAFESLFYSNAGIMIPETVTFKPSPQRSETRIVRYHNFRLEPTNISFDYTIAGNQWFIGTTQAMFRLMLEKVE